MADVTVDKLEELQKKYDKLLTLAAKLRHHQIRNTKYKTSVDFEKGVYYGRKLDHLLKQELNKMPASQKLDLFNEQS